jgi:hypothetical protein
MHHCKQSDGHAPPERLNGTWWIVLTAAETKEKRGDERPVPEELTNSIERYLEPRSLTLIGARHAVVLDNSS